MLNSSTSKIKTKSGKLEYIRVDKCFKCPVCGSRKRSQRQYCSSACRKIDKARKGVNY